MSKPTQTVASSTTADLKEDRKIQATNNNEGENAANVVLQYGRHIRPAISSKVAVELVERLYDLKVLSVSELNSYYDHNFLVKIDPQSKRNTFVEDIWPHGYVLKVLSSMDTREDRIGIVLLFLAT